MKSRRKTVSQQLREAIQEAPVSRYQIARETGVSEGVLSRFVHRQRSIDVATVDKLAAFLELGLLPFKRRKAKGD
jgi:transcriptional regulator with XRE-family HTH domain